MLLLSREALALKCCKSIFSKFQCASCSLSQRTACLFYVSWCAWIILYILFCSIEYQYWKAAQSSWSVTSFNSLSLFSSQVIL